MEAANINLRVEELATDANCHVSPGNGGAILAGPVHKAPASTGDEGVAEDLATLFTFDRKAAR